MSNITEPSELQDFEQVVSHYFEALYRFAFSLTHAEADASDLTQQTFYIWATKRHQLRDQGKVKSWLFTTLHREFMRIRKRATHFPHYELSETIKDLPCILPETVNRIDGPRIIELLDQIQEPYRAAIILFYLEDYSYKEIADILEIPIGTVRSRLSRGIVQLQEKILLMDTGRASVSTRSRRVTLAERSRGIGTPCGALLGVCGALR